MSRHRNVRAMDYDEEYDGYYSCYGHSVEEDSCISPRTEAQFSYNRNSGQQPHSTFFEDEVPEEEDQNDDYEFEELTPIDKAKLQSCIECMQNVVGDTVSEEVLSKTARSFHFDSEKALDAILSDLSGSKKNIPPVALCVKLQEDTKCKEKITLSPFTRICDNTAKNVTPVTLMCDKEKTNEYSTPSIPSRKRNTAVDAIEMYKTERGDKKPLLNLVVIGHVDAGKSTLMGHLLFNLGFVEKKVMHKYEQESKKLGKASFMYAWVLDETSEERNRGITMDVAHSRFETPHRIVNMLDAPGHKDFITSMITGAAQADVAVLVVDATTGEFETGFEAGGQTREHTMLIRSLGVSQLAIAVNKMDNVKYAKERYDVIVKKLTAFCKQSGFKDSDISFIPCSGLTGENLTALPENENFCSWYSGPTLADVIDLFETPERPVTKPLRIAVEDVFKGVSGGFSVAGKILCGIVRNGDKLSVMPAGETASVRGINIAQEGVPQGFAGDNIVIQLLGIDMSTVSCGNILCDIDSPVKVSYKFEARIIILNIMVPITKGFPVILHCQNLNEQAVITKLVSEIHRSSGELLKKRPRCLSKHSSAIVHIEVPKPICIELYKDFKDLGRFMLRSGGSSIAAGVVTRIM